MKEDRIRKEYEEIDLYDYVRVIWRWRWLIAIGVIVATLVSIPASYLVRSYESHGVLRLSESIAGGTGEELQQKDFLEKPLGEIIVESSKPKAVSAVSIVTLPEYKIYSAAFTDSRSFLHYLHDQKIFPAEQKAYIVEKLRKEPGLENYIKPLYAYTEQEMKNFRPTEQFISAVQLSWKGSSPELAQRMVDAMGLFVKDVLEKKIMEEYANRGYQEAYTKVQEFERSLVDLRFSLKQNAQKFAELKKIAQRVPEGEQLSSREVVSVEQGGHRYLPPSTQMVAAQVEIVDTKLTITDTERQLKINQLRLKLFAKLKGSLQEKVAGSLFDRLGEIKENFFQDKDVSNDEVLIVRNEISADFSRFEHRFRDVMRFISGPTFPQRAKPSKRIVVAITFFLGLFFFTLLAFFLEFIQQGKLREIKQGKTKRKK